MHDKFDFISPRSRYYGKFTPDHPEHMVFNANLQEFAQRVSVISCLETGGKLPPEDAYKQIKKLWKQLKRSKQQLGIGPEADEAE